MSATIRPEAILRELSELWVSLAHEPAGEAGAGVLRACALTLVTAAEESDDASVIGETLAALMREHPSRAIVVRLRPSTERALEARVFAQCWMPFGQRRQICCEQIEIVASESSLPDLPAVIVPLAVADLPLVVWCRGARLFRLPEFTRLANVAQKVVLDSAVFPSPREILAELAERVRGTYALADLAWTRLTGWREVVSQVFENRTNLLQLPRISGVRIAFGGQAPTTGAYYFAAWLLNSLESAGARVRLAWEPGAGAPGKFRSIELVQEGGSFGVRLEAEGAAVSVTVDHLSTRTVLADSNDYGLLREELSVSRRDSVYERTLARAALLARGEA